MRGTNLFEHLHGTSQHGDDGRHGSSNLRSGAGNKLVDDLEAANLDLPFAVLFNFGEEGGKKDGDSPRGHDLDERKDGLDGSLADAGGLVGEAVADQERQDLFKDERLNGVAAALVAEELQKGAGTFAGDGVLLVGKSLLDGLSHTETNESVRALHLVKLKKRMQCMGTRSALPDAQKLLSLGLKKKTDLDQVDELLG